MSLPLHQQEPKREGVRKMVESVMTALTIENSEEEYPDVPKPSGFTGDSYKPSQKEKGWDGVPYAKIPKKD